ncbi:hypothetical protein chiPu_0029958, partial [Chiloscyllium punctatum]|nr:hypothetical protein [Chiloscyllium punctatum]
MVRSSAAAKPLSGTMKTTAWPVLMFCAATVTSGNR